MQSITSARILPVLIFPLFTKYSNIAMNISRPKSLSDYSEWSNWYSIGVYFMQSKQTFFTNEASHNVSDVWSLSCTSWLYFRPGVTSAALQMNSRCVFPYFKETQQWCERKMSHLLCSPVQITRGRKIDNHLCFSERIETRDFLLPNHDKKGCL